MAERTFRIWRGNENGGEFKEYKINVDEGMVVLDVLHRIQTEQANDMAIRWNCKAGKCGSCSMEINGQPRLACMNRMNEYEPDETITVSPVKTFELVKDLVTDVNWNYEQNKKIAPFKPGPKGKDGKYGMNQESVERTQEFRKCIECFLCQNVCHVLRDHERKDAFVGPRFMVRLASLEMHPLDTADRVDKVKEEHGSGYCNITKCCTVVCPESIKITDNAIIPLKERIVDRKYDPVMWILRKMRGN